MAKKRAFVKYTKKGKIIPGSLIVTTNGGYPVDGVYKEVPYDVCCGDSGGCCKKQTYILPLLNSNLITYPITRISISVGCRTPGILYFNCDFNDLSFATLEEAFSYFNQINPNNVTITLISPTEISITICKPNIECMDDFDGCNGYSLNLQVNPEGTSIADACNINLNP